MFDRRCGKEFCDVLSYPCCGPVDLLKIRSHESPEIGQSDGRVVSFEQAIAEFLLQLLDCARERGLGHPAAFGRAGEILLLAESKKIGNLMHFHRHGPSTIELQGLSRPE